MALTWKNVDAPNFSGVGNLMQGGMVSLNDAFNNIAEQARRREAIQRSRYSNQALIDMMGVTDPNSISQFAKGLDSKKLTSDALSLIMAQPDTLQDRQSKGIAIEKAQDLLNFGREDRLAAANAAEASLGAAADIFSGNRERAFDTIRNLSGQDAAQFQPLLAETIRYIPESQNVRETDYGFGRRVGDDQSKDMALDVFQSEIMNPTRGARNRDEALRIADQLMADGRIDPAAHKELRARIEDTDDDYYLRKDPFMPDFFSVEGNEGLARELQDFNTDRAILDTHMKDRLGSYSNIDKWAESIEGGTPLEMVKSVYENFGAGTAGSRWVGEMGDWDAFEKGVQKMLKAKGLSDVNVGSPEVQRQMAAALGITAATSNWAWDDSRKTVIDEAIKYFVDSKDPKVINESIRTEAEYSAAQDSMAAAVQNIEALTALHKDAIIRGNTEEASRLGSEIANAVKSLSSLQKEYAKRFNIEPQEEPEEPARGDGGNKTTKTPKSRTNSPRYNPDDPLSPPFPTEGLDLSGIDIGASSGLLGPQQSQTINPNDLEELLRYLNK